MICYLVYIFGNMSCIARIAFPTWPRLTLNHCCPGLDKYGVDVLDKLLTFDPRKRYGYFSSNGIMIGTRIFVRVF